LAGMSAGVHCFSFRRTRYAARSACGRRYAELGRKALSRTAAPSTPIVLLHANQATSESWAPRRRGLCTAQGANRVIAFRPSGWARALPIPTTGPNGRVAGESRCARRFSSRRTNSTVGVAGGGCVSIDNGPCARNVAQPRLVPPANVTHLRKGEMPRFQRQGFEIPSFASRKPVYREGPSLQGRRTIRRANVGSTRRACPANGAHSPPLRTTTLRKLARRSRCRCSSWRRRRRSLSPPDADGAPGRPTEDLTTGPRCACQIRPRDRPGSHPMFFNVARPGRS